MLGLRYEVGGDKFKIWGQTKVGVMANMERINVASGGLNQIKGVAPPPPPDNTFIGGSGNGAGLQATNFTQSSTHVSPLFDTSINIEFPFFSMIPYVNKIHFLQNANVRMGWNFVAVDAMSRAAQIISYEIPQILAVAIPVMLAGATLLLPAMAIVAMVGMCHTLFLLWLGVRRVLNVPRGAQAEFVGISLVLLTFVSVLIGAAASAIGLL
jgi:hypothetical protein